MNGYCVHKDGFDHCSYECQTGKEPTPQDCQACCTLWAGIHTRKGLETLAQEIRDLSISLGTAEFTLRVDE